jgi:hypothetical protein
MDIFAWLFGSKARREAHARFVKDLRAIKFDNPVPAINALLAAAPAGTVDDAHTARRDYFESFARSLAAKNAVSRNEVAELQAMGEALQVPPMAIDRWQQRLAPAYLLWGVQNGVLPEAATSPIALQGGEVLHASVPGFLVEEQVVSRGYKGGSQGVSVRIAKGVTYRVGANRGRLVSEKGMVRVATGSLCVTSKRLVFAGNTKSFALDWRKVVNVELDRHGLLASGASGPAKIVQFSPALTNADMFRAILDTAMQRAVA